MPRRRTSPRRAPTRMTYVPDELGDDELDGATFSDRLVRAAPWLALLALVVGGAGLAVAWLNRGGDLAACRTAAWTAVPDPRDLPANWTLSSTDMNANGMTVSIGGPASADGSTTQPIVYASVTCYGDVAATAMKQNRTAAETSGATVVDRGAGAEAYDVRNASTGSVTTIFRVGQLIGQVADAGTADPADLATITAALARAMGDESAAGRPGSAAPRPSGASSGAPAGSGDLGEGSAPPSAPVAPELEAVMPTSVLGTPLSVDSATGDQALAADPASRAFAARLTSLGAKVANVQVARAFDDTQSVDVAVVGFRLPGFDPAKLKAAVLEAWLGAGEAGVKQTAVTLGGKRVIKVDYGGGGAIDYVYATADHVIVIDTGDESAAADVASQLK
jgi:hypothetical protein